ncbi:hypothetical protein LSTR_LSTR012938 [Laodelphax striatellus]|uniref:Major facilitator superfamily (MFS) profile domain-containing protein n=1 Tax=Laodelphax striatellus TaxID=195883 RepID=A0A482XIN1_LAOST|nr:hypothetical protein LSTR_LSTR012938 [Laodelphax striatellus]
MNEEIGKSNGNADFTSPNTSSKLRHPFRQALPQILATTAKNILLLGYGMTLGFPTIVIPNLAKASNSTTDPYNLTLTRDQISWFSSINLICVPLGCFLSGVLTQPFGRKPSMMALNVPFIVAWLIYHHASSVNMLYAALVITGFSGGVLEAPVLTYVAEITTPQLRGMLSATASMIVILGVFIQFIFGTFLHWRTIALVNVVFPVLAMIALYGVPESPHWLMGKGRVEDAEKSLQWLRGWVEPHEVQVELSHLAKAIKSSNFDESQRKRSWHAFKEKTFLRPYFLVSMAFLFGHFCGMTTLQTFAVSIFAEMGTPIDKYLATLILGLVQLLGALTCVVLVHWTGKRPLAMVSLVGNSVCWLVVAMYASWFRTHQHVTAYSWVPMTFLICSAFLTHMCIRLLPWVLVGEVYTPEVRATASGASGSAGYIFGFLANKSYFMIMDRIEASGTFTMYTIVSIGGALFLYYFLPETEGRTLLEIQEHFAGNRCLIGKQDTNSASDRNKENYAADNPGMDHVESHL